MSEKAIPGAHEARKAVKSFAAIMAADDLLPAQYLGHASGGFVLASAINSITALFLSRNYNLIPRQIAVAYRALCRHEWHDDVGSGYRSTAMKYLCVTSRYLRDFVELERSEDLLIPAELLVPIAAPPERDVASADPVDVPGGSTANDSKKRRNQDSSIETNRGSYVTLVWQEMTISKESMSWSAGAVSDTTARTAPTSFSESARSAGAAQRGCRSPPSSDETAESATDADYEQPATTRAEFEARRPTRHRKRLAPGVASAIARQPIGYE